MSGFPKEAKGDHGFTGLALLAWKRQRQAQMALIQHDSWRTSKDAKERGWFVLLKVARNACPCPQTFGFGGTVAGRQWVGRFAGWPLKPYLSGANLSGANLLGANLFGADLSGADLSGAKLLRANLSGANLSGASPLGGRPLAGPTSRRPTSRGPTSRGPTSRGPTSRGPTSRAPTSRGSTSRGPTSENGNAGPMDLLGRRSSHDPSQSGLLGEPKDHRQS